MSTFQDFNIFNILNISVFNLEVQKKARLQPTKKSGVRRVPETVEHANAADNALYQSAGYGLDKFEPEHRLRVGEPLVLVPEHARDRASLKIVIDRKASGFKTFNYLFYSEGLRGFPARDIFHGEWRDFLNGVNASGGFVALCKLILIQNMSKNPWLGGDFRRQKEDHMRLLSLAVLLPCLPFNACLA